MFRDVPCSGVPGSTTCPVVLIKYIRHLNKVVIIMIMITITITITIMIMIMIMIMIIIIFNI